MLFGGENKSAAVRRASKQTEMDSLFNMQLQIESRVEQH